MMKTKLAIGAALAGAAIFGATVVSWSAAQPEAQQSKAPEQTDSTSFSDLQESEIEEIVRAYLLEHPEVIIEAVNRYSARERELAQQRAVTGASENLAALMDASTGYVAGKDVKNAKVAVIELFDYHCGYCKRATGLVNDLVKSDKDIKVVFRELPILREESEIAAELALASREQGKFLDFHFALMNSKGTLTKDRILSIAKKEGLDISALEKAQKDASVEYAIRENHALAQAMGVDGTPAFIIASVDGSYVDVINGYSAEAILGSIADAKDAAKN